MAEQITPSKLIYNKRQYERVIDTSFTQLVAQPTGSTPTITVPQFFQYYQDLFFDIPKFGDTNSHAYLIKTSQEYIGTVSSNDDLIQALITETNQLREENLTLQQQLLSGSL
jgi:retron-type reverse transcriptase